MHGQRPLAGGDPQRTASTRGWATALPKRPTTTTSAGGKPHSYYVTTSSVVDDLSEFSGADHSCRGGGTRGTRGWPCDRQIPVQRCGNGGRSWPLLRGCAADVPWHQMVRRLRVAVRWWCPARGRHGVACGL